MPIECVPSARVAVSHAMHAPCHACPPPCTPLPCMPLPCIPFCHASLSSPSMPPLLHMPPFAIHVPFTLTEFLTHAGENINFPQLLMRTVKINRCFNLKSALFKNTSIMQTADAISLLTSTNFDKMSKERQLL